MQHFFVVIGALNFLDIWGMAISAGPKFHLPITLRQGLISTWTNAMIFQPKKNLDWTAEQKFNEILGLNISDLAAFDTPFSAAQARRQTFSIDNFDLSSLTNYGHLDISWTPYRNEHLLIRPHLASDGKVKYELLIYWFILSPGVQKLE
jgi:hypothetical protein